MTYLENADYFVRIVDLPVGVKGLVSPNDDGTYNVYLDGKSDREHQIDTYFHELDHIENDDFYNGRSLRDVEGL